MTSTPSPQKKLIFISYSRRDLPYADELEARLRESGLETWIDRRGIGPGQNFVASLSDALSVSGYLVLLVSKHSMDSTWVQNEWTAAFASDTVVIPLRIDDAPLPALLAPLSFVDASTDWRAGLETVTEWLVAEFERPPVKMGAGEDQFPRLSRRQLRLVASRCVGPAQLKEYCYDRDMSWHDLGGDSHKERLVSLLHELGLEAGLEDFGRWLAYERARCFETQLGELRSRPDWNLL